jgi:nucleoside-diphosphate-sugar epimerase
MDRILVTGASGYVASHIIKILLENGHNVRGTVRSL